MQGPAEDRRLGDRPVDMSQLHDQGPPDPWPGFAGRELREWTSFPMLDRDPEGPAPAALCQVLRCPSGATRFFLVEKTRWGLFETMVCGSHCAALRSGAAFVYNSGENVIYMGVDVSVID
jgi:hypothetical protein